MDIKQRAALRSKRNLLIQHLDATSLLPKLPCLTYDDCARIKQETTIAIQNEHLLYIMQKKNGSWEQLIQALKQQQLGVFATILNDAVGDEPISQLDLQMNSQQKAALKYYRNYFINELKAIHLLPDLFCLTSDDCCRIKNEITVVAQNAALLEILSKRDGAWNQFINALREHRHTYEAQMLLDFVKDTPPGQMQVPMDLNQRRAIESTRNVLIEYLDARNLLIFLPCLTTDDCDRIKHGKTRSSQNELLLDIIINRDGSWVQLIEALKCQNQDFLALLLNAAREVEPQSEENIHMLMIECFPHLNKADSKRYQTGSMVERDDNLEVIESQIQRPMNLKQQAALKYYRSIFIDELYATDFLPYLFCLTNDDHCRIKNEITTRAQNAALLEVLSNRDGAWNQFINALRKNGHTYKAQFLLDFVKDTPPGQMQVPMDLNQRRTIESTRNVLIEHLDARNLLTFLPCLTTDDCDRIKREVSISTQNDLLLDIIINRDGSWVQLIEALKCQNQDFLAQLLNERIGNEPLREENMLMKLIECYPILYNVELKTCKAVEVIDTVKALPTIQMPMNLKQQAALKYYRRIFINELYGTDFLPYLFCLTNDDHCRIKNEITTRAQNAALLEILSKRDGAWNQFINALREHRHTYEAQMLLDFVKDTPPGQMQVPMDLNQRRAIESTRNVLIECLNARNLLAFLPCLADDDCVRIKRETTTIRQNELLLDIIINRDGSWVQLIEALKQQNQSALALLLNEVVGIDEPLSEEDIHMRMIDCFRSLYKADSKRYHTRSMVERDDNLEVIESQIKRPMNLKQRAAIGYNRNMLIEDLEAIHMLVDLPCLSLDDCCRIKSEITSSEQNALFLEILVTKDGSWNQFLKALDCYRLTFPALKLIEAFEKAPLNQIQWPTNFKQRAKIKCKRCVFVEEESSIYTRCYFCCLTSNEGPTSNWEITTIDPKQSLVRTLCEETRITESIP